jgi:hypothetical protein
MHADEDEKAGEREGGRRVKTQAVEGRGNRSASWYVVLSLHIPARLKIIFSRKIGSLKWNMHKTVKKDNRTSCDNGKTNFAVHLNFQGREIGREGLAPRKGEGHPVIEACSIPQQNMTLASPVGIDGSEPVGKRKKPGGKKPKDYSEPGNQATLGGGK